VCRTGDSANDQSVHPGAQWCPEADVNPTANGKRLSLTLCRDSSAGGTLTFDSTREVDFAVTRGGKTIWTWSHDHPGSASQHTLSAAADGCWVWSLVWPGVTQAGRSVGEGAYTLVATTTAQELQGSPSTQVDFSY
jgi:predicted lipoprotein with Yx(FWY)xxD motif